MTILADHNLEGQALLLWGVFAHEGWLDLILPMASRLAWSGLCESRSHGRATSKSGSVSAVPTFVAYERHPEIA